MAESRREPTTTLPMLVSTSATSANPLHNKSIFAPAPTSPARPFLSSIAHAGLSASAKPLTYKSIMTPQFQPLPLTGAAAIEDNRRHEKELEQKTLAGTTPNPARVAHMVVAAQPMSRPADAPLGSSRAQHPMALPVITTESPPKELARDSSMTVASPMEMNTPVDRSTNNATPNPRKRPASPRMEERSSKAMTFPPLQNNEETSPRTRRDMTFPSHSSTQGSGRSPQSSKKHKCPHCSTEFTRHHNLKSHLLTHSQEKPYGCQECTARFRRLHDLKRHIKLHTGEKSHACVKCGRKFARGDALARHNRGPGGCAGRRGSAGDGGEYGDEEVDETGQNVEGVSYQGEDGREHYEGEDAYVNDSRRRSEPDRARSDTMNSINSATSGTYHHHSSTYPGPLPISHRGLYPPAGPSSQSITTSLNDAPKHLSPKPPFSTVQYNNNTSPYPQANITDSPKPLSPGQADLHRLGYSNPPVPPQSTQNRQQSRSHGGESLYGSLPVPTSQSTPLPSLSADPHFSQSSPGAQPPPLYVTQHIASGQSSSHSGAGSTSSSHQQNSASSLHNVLRLDSARPTQQSYDDMREQVRNLERRVQEVTDHYEAENSRLREEIRVLKKQPVPL